MNSTRSQPKHLVRLSPLRGRASKSEQSQNQANALLEHFGSVANLTRASVQDLSRFVSPTKAAQLVSSLRLAAIALRVTMTTFAVSTYDRGLTDPRELSGLEALSSRRLFLY